MDKLKSYLLDIHASFQNDLVMYKDLRSKGLQEDPNFETLISFQQNLISKILEFIKQNE